MSITRLDQHLAEATTLGGAVLGGGGGGSLEDGLERAGLAVRLGSVDLLSLDELNDEDLIITASAVGAPAAASHQVTWRSLNPASSPDSLEASLSGVRSSTSTVPAAGV